MRATKEYRLSCTEEAKKIVDRLTLEQKVWLMSGNIDITRMRQEDMAQMMEAMQDGSNHYNVTPYTAGGTLHRQGDQGVRRQSVCRCLH